MHRGRLLVALLIVVLPGVVLAPVWRNGGLGAGEDDILYYFPMRALIGWFSQAGEPPFLNPWTGCGRPYLADPQTAVFYPTTWLFARLPAETAYPLSLWLHYSLAMFGAYRLVRAGGCGRRAAIFGAISFALGGFMVAHRAHFSMQHAAAWTPIVLWRLGRYVGSAERFDAARLSLATVAIAFQCLAGHVQIAALTGLAAVTLAATDPTAGPAMVRTRRTLLPWLIGGLIFAVQWAPTLAYANVCDRGDRTYWDFVENSLHPASLFAFVLPMFLGQRTPNFFDQPWWGPSHQVEQVAYMGIGPLLLALLAVRAGGWADPRRRPWIVLVGVGLLLALGKYGPICPVLYWLPGAGLFRCPARALLLVNLAACVLAAHAMQALAAPPNPLRAAFRHLAKGWLNKPVVLGAALVAAPLAATALALPLLGAATRAAALYALRPWNPAVWMPLAVAVATTALLARAVRRWDQPAGLNPVIALLVLDLAVVGWTLDVPANVAGPTALTTPSDAAWIEPVRASGRRLWVVTRRSSPESLPGEYIDPLEKLVAGTNSLHRVRALTDYGPLQPREFARRFCFKPWGESTCVTDLLRDTSWAGLYDVGWILLCEPDLPAPEGFVLHTTTRRGTRLYHDGRHRAFATLQNGSHAAQIRYVPVGTTAFQVEVLPLRSVAVDHASDETHESSSRLVFANAALPGWTVSVDGNIAPAINVGGLLAADVPADRPCLVAAQYAPPGFEAGLRLSVAATVLLLLINGAGIVAAARRTGLRRTQDAATVPG